MSTVPANTLKTLSIILLSSVAINATPLYPANTDTSIGTDDFRALLLNHDELFVDKTFLLDEFIKLEGSRLVPLIIRPKGWGKSINLDMIRRFFEIEVDSVGERLPKDKTINDKLFMADEIDLNSTTTKKLKKLEVSSFVTRHLGQFPVILLKLKNTTGVDYADIESKIKARVTEAFKDHEYLLNSTRITDKEKLRNYTEGEFNTTDLKSSILFLSHKLNEHFGRKVHILIDDYDQPIINAYIAFGSNFQQFEILQELLIDVYTSAMKDNPNLNIGLLVGVLHVSLTPTMTSGLNNLDVCTLTRTKFSKSFGLRKPELFELFRLAPPMKIDLQGMMNWYNGYNYNEHIYFNAWSTMQCLALNGALGNHGFDIHHPNPLVDKILLSDEMQENLHLFISGKSMTLPNLHSRTEPINWVNMNRLEVLFLNGYLSQEITPIGISSNVVIPNKQMKHIYEAYVLRWVCSKLGVDVSKFHLLASLLSDAKVDEFRGTLKIFLSHEHDFLYKVLYRGIVIALKNVMDSTHTDQEDETNDLVLIPKPNVSDVAIILKYEIGRTENLISMATAGLQEINSSQIGGSLKTISHVRQIIKISIAFCREKLALEYNID